MVWLLIGALTKTSQRWIVPCVLIALGGYFLFVLFVDFRFLVSIVFTLPPLIALLCLFIKLSVQRQSQAAVIGSIAILLMFLALVLQQMHIGLHPIYFNYNALYHLIQGIALALLFTDFRQLVKQ